MAELLVHSCLVNDIYFSCIVILYVIENRQIYDGPGLTIRKLVKYKFLNHIAKSCNKELCIFWLQISEQPFFVVDEFKNGQVICRKCIVLSAYNTTPSKHITYSSLNVLERKKKFLIKNKIKCILAVNTCTVFS